MNKTMLFICSLLLLMMLGLTWNYCNIYEWAHTPGDSDDPATLLIDGESLWRSQQFEEAICVYHKVANELPSASNEDRIQGKIGLTTSMLVHFFGWEDLLPVFMDLLMNQMSEDDSEDDSSGGDITDQFDEEYCLQDELPEMASLENNIFETFFPNLKNTFPDKDRLHASGSVIKAEQAYLMFVDYQERIALDKKLFVRCPDGSQKEIKSSIVEEMASIRELVDRNSLAFITNEINYTMSVFLRILMGLLDTNANYQFLDPPDYGEDKGDVVIVYDNFKSILIDPQMICEFNELSRLGSRDFQENPITKEEVIEYKQKIETYKASLQGVDLLLTRLDKAVSEISLTMQNVLFAAEDMYYNGTILEGTYNLLKDFKKYALVGEGNNDAWIDILIDYKEDITAVRAMFSIILMQLELAERVIDLGIDLSDLDDVLLGYEILDPQGNPVDISEEIKNLDEQEKSIILQYFQDIKNSNDGFLQAIGEEEMLGVNVFCEEDKPEDCPSFFNWDYNAVECWLKNGDWIKEPLPGYCQFP